MVRRHPDHRRAKSHYTYSVDELARLFGVHSHTVRNWQMAGLKPVDNARPAIFRGETVAAFLSARRTARKRPCGPGEMFCLPCRQPKRPDGGMVDYQPRSETLGRLAGLCPTCGRMMFRAVARDRVAAATCGLDVQFSTAELRLNDSPKALVDCDSKRRPTTP